MDKSHGKKPFGRPKRMWGGINKIGYAEEIKKNGSCDYVDCI
jgi:hypothetical protein